MSKRTDQKLLSLNDGVITICDPLKSLLLRDFNTGANIIWATDNYVKDGHQEKDEIAAEATNLIRPRIEKSKKEQQIRSRDKAEVFTPSWICNKQNNLIDADWFGVANPPFNSEGENSWKTIEEKIDFANYEKSPLDYINDIRLEITCGEAPYLTSRYDAVTGEMIAIKNRVGLLDRKLRVVRETSSTMEEWLSLAEKALKSCYGYEFQGDSLFIARENVMLSFAEHFLDCFGQLPPDSEILKTADIVTWNLWQMDGIKYVVPMSCKSTLTEQFDIFGGSEITESLCPGCRDNAPKKHNGTPCYIKDWDKGKKILFVSLVKGI